MAKQEARVTQELFSLLSLFCETRSYECILNWLGSHYLGHADLEFVVTLPLLPDCCSYEDEQLGCPQLLWATSQRPHENYANPF